jgi:hypothetical protein
LEFAQTQLFTGSELAANARMQQPGESERALQKQRTKTKADPSLKALRDDNVETKAGSLPAHQDGQAAGKPHRHPQKARLGSLRSRYCGPQGKRDDNEGAEAGSSSDAGRILTRNDSEKAKRRRAPATPESARRTALRLRSERAALQRGKSLRSVSQESRDGT